MIIYMMRHGESDWNVQHLFQGRTDIPLNENGRKVAEWTRDGLKDVHFDAAFCSPLCRLFGGIIPGRIAEVFLLGCVHGIEPGLGLAETLAYQSHGPLIRGSAGAHGNVADPEGLLPVIFLFNILQYCLCHFCIIFL